MGHALSQLNLVDSFETKRSKICFNFIFLRLFRSSNEVHRKKKKKICLVRATSLVHLPWFSGNSGLEKHPHSAHPVSLFLWLLRRGAGMQHNIASEILFFKCRTERETVGRKGRRAKRTLTRFISVGEQQSLQKDEQAASFPCCSQLL